MTYFIYDTEEEIKNIDSIICKGENIGQNESDITKRYSDFILLENGKFGYIADDITNKYIKDKETINV